jgi:eukaryotic-like serine/threonine-protein kinase
VKHDRDVALKVLKPELAAILGRERFLNEIRLTAQLDHPHIVTLIDSGETGGLLWYVLPFIRGESLRDRLNREKQLGVEEALAIARQVAGALDYAHARGVIHRDLKPENILLHEGEAMLADFGIALAVKEAGGNRLTETGLSLGTPQYMSPEQATGVRVLDARSDIYSIAAVLYEMLAGEPPHTGATVQAVIAKLMTERPTRLRTVRDTVPESVDAAVAKALAKVPSDRFATAHEFAAALRAPLASDSTTVVVARRPSMRRTAVVVAGLLGIALLAAVALLPGRGRTSTPATTARRPLTTSGAASQPALSPDGKMVAYVLNGTDVLVQDLAGGDPLPIVRGTVSVRYPRWTPDGSALLFLGELRRGEAGLFVVPRLGGAPRRVAEASLAFAIDPAGESVLVSRFDPMRGSALVRLRLKDGVVVDTLWNRPVGPAVSSTGDLDSQPLIFYGLEWSPDGRWIAFSATRRLAESGNGIGLMSASGAVTDIRGGFVGPIQWGPRSDAIYYFPDNTRAEFDLVRWSVSPSGTFAGDPVVIMSRVPGLDGSLSVSPDGRSAAFISGLANNHVSLLTIDPAKATLTERKVTGGTAWHGFPTLSPDGRFMVYSKGDQRGDNLYRFPIDSGAERPLTETTDWNHRPKISPDGARLAFVRTGLEAKRPGLFIMPADGGSPREITAGQVDWSGLTAGPLAWLSPTRLLLRTTLTPNQYRVVDVERGDTVTLSLPDSLRLPALFFQASDGSLNSSPWQLAPSPSGAGFAVAARIHDSLFVLRGSPDLKQWIRLAPAGAGERLALLRWGDQDWIYFAHWAPTDTVYWLSRVRATGGRPELRLPIPKSCRISPERLSSDGRRMVCESPGSSTYDVWIAENFDPGSR